MGASGWQYFVPYQEDVQQALTDLRAQVFESGKYYKRFPFWQTMNEEDYQNGDPDQAKYMVNWLRQMKAMKEPTTIEELMEWNGEEGTHSILDIEWVGDLPEYGVAVPISEEVLIDVFGDAQPSHARVEANLSALYAAIDRRYEATYFIIYDDGKPAEILFIGFSGD